MRCNFVFILIFFTLIFNNQLISQTYHEHYIDGEIYLKVDLNSVVSLYPDFDHEPDIVLIANTFNIDSISRPFPEINDTLNNIYRVYFSNLNNTNLIIEAFENLSFIKYAEKSPLYRIDVVPNDYDGVKLWHLEKINATSAWSVSSGSEDVVIAIVDNGVLLEHEDLKNNIWLNPGEIPDNNIDDELNGYVDDMHGWDVADNNNNPNPPGGINSESAFNHGSHCAGIASAVTNNGKGIASIGYRTKIMAVKCSRNSTEGNVLTNVDDGIYYAIRSNADIISMSFGTEGTSLTGRTILQTAYNLGILLVAAAGNGNTSNRYYPASYPEVIGVGATDQNDKKAGFSNYGNLNVELMAPGTNIYSTLGHSKSDYGYLSGTSMAAPLVAGLAALILADDPGLSASQVRQILRNSCDEIDSKNPDYAAQLGYGRINAARALGVDDTSTDREINDKESGLSIFPNPSIGIPTIKYVSDMNAETFFIIYDSQGRELIRISKKLNENEIYFLEYSDIQNVIEYEGIYLIQAVQNDYSVVERFVVK